MKARLSWICHGPTEANRKGCFPDDEPLEAKAAQRAKLPVARLATIDRVWTAPALRARQTAAILGPDAILETALRECDYGEWCGKSLAELHESDPESLALWMTDLDAAPHGGESLSSVVLRIGEWMGHHLHDAGHTVAVTHASVIRAAVLHVLQAPLAAFWTIDVEPFGMVEMTSDGRRWQLRFPRMVE
ncbi:MULTISPECIES: histidine phosphatase family protein [Rhizobium]|jgi:broad specificity phosphatase PhoE|uniref:Broad specificity phosphatase PhoE n=1 Tax=Rhizobium lusitanum TaxID=293958 RepID=A0A1C3XIC5_9HYPH|nr:histidine phosphatase family protein [Rhizobium lusitanum]NTJ05520.1 histidine phosphatase family protein [Rhizobium lusitanum]SCB52041.1 Broad specificity phosphatase PhoE [Rhizobium lusitanum]